MTRGKGKSPFRWSRSRTFKLLALSLIAIPLLAYLLRGPLLGKPLARLASGALSDVLGIPVRVDHVGGSWFRSLEITGLKTVPPDPEETFLHLDLDRILLRYSLPSLLLGRTDWLEEIDVQGKFLRLDLDRLPTPAKPPTAPPGPPGILRYEPAARLHLDRFWLKTGGKLVAFEALRLRLDQAGAFEASAKQVTPPFLPEIAGPLVLEGRRSLFRFEEIDLSLGPITLEGALLDLTHLPGNILACGTLSHTCGRIEAELELTPDELLFEIISANLHPASLIELPPGLPPETAALVVSLSANGALPLREPRGLDARWSLSLATDGDLLPTGKLSGRIEEGVLHLEQSSLEMAGLSLSCTGTLCLEGQWEGGLAARMSGPQPLATIFGVSELVARGTVEATASGNLAGPLLGQAQLRFDSITVGTHPSVEDLRVSLRLDPTQGITLDALFARAAGGTLSGSGRIDTGRSMPAWKARVEVAGAEFSALAPDTQGRIDALALLAEGRGDRGTFDLVATLRLAPGSTAPEAAFACQGGFRLGTPLLFHPWRFEGAIFDQPFELLRPVTLRIDPEGIAASEVALSLGSRGSSRLNAKGRFPPRGPGDGFELRALLDPKLIGALFPESVLPKLTAAGLHTPEKPTSVEADVQEREVHIRVSGTGNRAGKVSLLAVPAGAATTRVVLNADLGSLARSATLEASLSFPLDRMLAGVLPKGPELYSELDLFLAFQDASTSVHPELGVRGAIDGTLAIHGPRETLAMTLSSAGLALGQGPEPFLVPWAVGLEANWHPGGVRARVDANESSTASRLEAELFCEVPIPSLSDIRLSALGQSFREGLFQARVACAGLPASLLAPGLSPAPEGSWTGTIELGGTLEEPVGRMEIDMRSCSWSPREPKVRAFTLGGTKLVAALKDHQIQVSLEGDLEPGGRFKAEGTGAIDLAALLQEGPLLPPEGKIEATVSLEDLRLDALQGFSEELLELSGLVTGSARLSGTWSRPEPSGLIEFRDGFLRTRSALPAVEEIQGAVRIRPDAIVLEGFTAEAAGGRLALGGGIEDPFGTPRFDFSLQGQETLLSREGGLRVRANMDVSLRGTIDKARLAGAIDLTDGRLRRHLPLLALGIEAAGRAAEEVPALFESGGIAALPGPAAGRPPFSIQGPFAENLELDLTLRVSDPPFQVVTNVLRGPFQARLRLRGSAASPWIEGDLTADDGGTLTLPGLTLRIQALRVAFDPTDPNRPRAYMVAHGRKHSIDVQLVAQGPPDDIGVELTSIPPYPKEDLVLFVTTGTMPRDLASGGRAALGVLGNYVGAELLEYIAGGDDEGAEGGWFQDRFSVEIGSEVGRDGKENIRAEMSLREIHRNLYMQAERDTLSAYNLGLLLRWRWR